jgi:hypothetical protein
MSVGGNVVFSPLNLRGKLKLKKKNDAIRQVSIPKAKIILTRGTICVSTRPTTVELNVSVQANILAAPPWKHCGDTHEYT